MQFPSRKGLRFNDRGLIPAIIQDAANKSVLMYVYMNHESLKKTRKTGVLWLYHRKHKQVWKKGNRSGRTMEMVNIMLHHDRNILLIEVKPNGPACHTGNTSCFYEGSVADQGVVQETPADEFPVEDGLAKLRSLFDEEDSADKPMLKIHEEDSAKSNPVAPEPARPDGLNKVKSENFSALFGQVQNRVLPGNGDPVAAMEPDGVAQKVGEQAMQLLASVSRKDRDTTADTAARMIHHIVLLLTKSGIDPDEFEVRWQEENWGKTNKR